MWSDDSLRAVTVENTSPTLSELFEPIRDDLARVALSGEIPLGILTSLFGTFVFVALLSTRRLRLKS